MSDYHPSSKPPTFMGPLSLDQAAPIQNQWYPVMPETPNVRLIDMFTRVMAVGESIEGRIIADGRTYGIFTIAGVAGTVYEVTRATSPTPLLNIFTQAAINVGRNVAFLLEAKLMQIDVRKTTANGAGNLQAGLTWSQYP